MTLKVLITAREPSCGKVVFTPVCLFTWGSAFPQCHGKADPPKKANPLPQILSASGWYTSYWNAYFLNLVASSRRPISFLVIKTCACHIFLTPVLK